MIIALCRLCVLHWARSAIHGAPVLDTVAADRDATEHASFDPDHFINYAAHLFKVQQLALAIHSSQSIHTGATESVPLRGAGAARLRVQAPVRCGRDHLSVSDRWLAPHCVIPISGCGNGALQ